MEKNLSYFMSLKYNTILSKQEGTYYLLLPELSIVEEGETPNAVYEKMEKSKESFFKKIIELNAQDTVKEPVGLTMRNKLIGELLSFCSKSIIISICLAAVFAFLLQSLPDISQRVVHTFAQRASYEIYKIDSLSDEDKEKIQSKIRTRLLQIKPFIDEFRKIIIEDEVKEYNNSVPTIKSSVQK